jgi:hypothetical protein
MFGGYVKAKFLAPGIEFSLIANQKRKAVQKQDGY